MCSKILALVFIRFGMSYLFTEKELSFLDDLIPGKNSKRRRKISLSEVNVELLEKVSQNPAKNRHEAIRNELTKAISLESETVKQRKEIRFSDKPIQINN